MQRYFIHMAYHGGAYCGWQIQRGSSTVQGVLNEALSMLLRSEVETVGCGRTDTGVHASSFYAHFDSETAIDELWLTFKLNTVLPKDIAVYDVLSVGEEHHARFSATYRSYTYRMHTRKDPFLDGLSLFTHYELDLDLMNRAGEFLMRTNDFAAFCKTGSDQKTTLCKLMQCEWHSEGYAIHLQISADRFLRNMVRSIVGTSIDLGRGKISLDDFEAIVQSKSRSRAGTSAPAHGLYLSAIGYPFL